MLREELLKIDQLFDFNKMKSSLGCVGGGPGVYTVSLIDHSVSPLKNTNGRYKYRHYRHIMR